MESSVWSNPNRAVNTKEGVGVRTNHPGCCPAGCGHLVERCGSCCPLCQDYTPSLYQNFTGSLRLLVTDYNPTDNSVITKD